MAKRKEDTENVARPSSCEPCNKANKTETDPSKFLVGLATPSYGEPYNGGSKGKAEETGPLKLLAEQTPFSNEACHKAKRKREKKKKAKIAGPLKPLAEQAKPSSNAPCHEASKKETGPSKPLPEQATPSFNEPCNKSKKNKAKKTGPSKPLAEQATPSSTKRRDEANKKKAKETNPSKPLAELADITIFDTLLPPVLQLSPNSKAHESKMNFLIQTEGSKYNLLYKAMISNVKNLAEGYECLQSFREAEMYEKSKFNPACTKGFSIGKVKFVMRKQFNKTQAENAITPQRVASVVALAADKVFREKLVPDSTMMQTAYQTIVNPFGIVHGFSVSSVPETDEQKKLYYYYLVTTISMGTLMEINPISCMAIAKWRLEGNNCFRLGLNNKALDIDETYARCLADIRATAKYLIKTKSSCFQFKPDDVIDNKVVMNKIMEEFLFLKRCAATPWTRRACKGLKY